MGRGARKPSRGFYPSLREEEVEERLYFSDNKIKLVIEVPKDYIDDEGPYKDSRSVRLTHSGGKEEKTLHLQSIFSGAGNSECTHDVPETMQTNSSVSVDIEATLDASGMVHINADMSGISSGAVPARLFTPGQKLATEEFSLWVKTYSPTLLQDTLEIEVVIKSKANLSAAAAPPPPPPPPGGGDDDDDDDKSSSLPNSRDDDDLVVVPNLVAKSEKEAKKLLKEAGLILEGEKIKKPSPDHSLVVKSQVPPAGSKTHSGSFVFVKWDLVLYNYNKLSEEAQEAKNRQYREKIKQQLENEKTLFKNGSKTNENILSRESEYIQSQNEDIEEGKYESIKDWAKLRGLSEKEALEEGVKQDKEGFIYVPRGLWNWLEANGRVKDKTDYQDASFEEKARWMQEDENVS